MGSPSALKLDRDGLGVLTGQAVGGREDRHGGDAEQAHQSQCHARLAERLQASRLGGNVTAITVFEIVHQAMSPAALESNKNSNDNPVEKFRIACAIRRLVTPN